MFRLHVALLLIALASVVSRHTVTARRGSEFSATFASPSFSSDSKIGYVRYRYGLARKSLVEILTRAIVDPASVPESLPVQEMAIYARLIRGTQLAYGDDLSRIITEAVDKHLEEHVPAGSSTQCLECVEKNGVKAVTFEVHRLQELCKVAFTEKMKAFCAQLETDPAVVVDEIVARQRINPLDVAYRICQVSGSCKMKGAAAPRTGAWTSAARHRQTAS